MTDKEDKIRISEKVHAYTFGKYLNVMFPYTKEAKDIIASVPGAFYSGSEWLVPSHRNDLVRKALVRIDSCLREQGIDVDTPDVKISKEVFALDETIAEGSVLEHETGHVTIVGMSKPFKAPASLARSSGKRITNKQSCYVWHRPSTVTEIDNHMATLEAEAVGEPGF